MAFTFEDMLIDRALEIVFLQNGKVVGGLNQIASFSINQTSETKDKTDAQGVLIKRFFTSKSVEVSGENATISLGLMALQNGTEKQVASADNKMVLPRIIKVKASDSPITLADTPVGQIYVSGLTATGVPDPALAYELDTQAGAGKYALSGNSVELPTDATDFVQITYFYEAESAVAVTDASDKFPQNCEMLVKVLACDPCDKETMRLVYIDFPSFQLSPDFDWTVDTESNQAFSGVATVDYCGTEKTLFVVSASEDDIEE